MNRTVERFSNGYYLVDAETLEYTGDDVRIPYELGHTLDGFVTKPLFKIGNRHIWPKEARDIPSETIAIPQKSDIPVNEEVLLAKDRTTAHLLRRDQVPLPE